jgi:hypothetical protein
VQKYLEPGRRLSFCTAEVSAINGSEEQLIATNALDDEHQDRLIVKLLPLPV